MNNIVFFYLFCISICNLLFPIFLPHIFIGLSFHLRIFNGNLGLAAIITTIYGSREKSLKATIKQTYPTDFYAFVDREDIPNRGNWVKDCLRYQTISSTKSPIDNNLMINSLNKNLHPYLQYKYYKMQFFLIPQLKKYKYIIWMDSSFSVRTSYTSERLINLLIKTNSTIMFYRHPYYKTVQQEANFAMHNSRWRSTKLWGIKQPFQNISKQIHDYFSNGFSDDYFGEIWVTGIYIIDMSKPKSIPFLNEWFLQTLNYSTQCQISLPYSAWKIGIKPKDISPGSIYENPYFVYHGHYK